MNLTYFEKITDPILLQTFFILSAISFSLSYIIIKAARYFFWRRSRQDELAVQSAHKGLTPRVGGLAIFFSLIMFAVFLKSGFLEPNFVLNLDIGSLNWLILSAIPVFLVGLLEDLGHHMQPIKRLLASAFSGVLVIIFFKTWVNAVGIPPFDILLVFAPLGILFTLFATIGVVNGFNLVDGLNGFASYITISSAIALSVVAFHINNIEVLRFLFILSACVIGFLMLNFPLGRIFLGDAGAYVLGHLLVWCGILIVYKTESVSPFSILLIFFWPVAETLLSIWRRWWHNKPADRPDRLHYHQLVMRFLEIRFFGRDKKHITNPLATTLLIPLVSIPQFLGVFFWNKFFATLWIALIFTLIFVCTYFVLMSVAKSPRIKNLSRVH